MNSELLSGKHVLVVEDEMLAAMLIEDTLADLGCTAVTVAADVETALAAIAKNPIDLATLDLNLGGGTKSYPVADALMERDIPFVFATGYGARGIDEEYRRHPVLTKPYTGAQFEMVMSELSDANK